MFECGREAPTTERPWHVSVVVNDTRGLPKAPVRGVEVACAVENVWDACAHGASERLLPEPPPATHRHAVVDWIVGLTSELPVD